MAALFGHAWVSSYGDSPSGIAADTWSKALAGLNPRQIAHGLRETLVIGSDFPPSAPRFRKLCFSIPSLLAVKGIMRRNEYDQFVCLVESNLDKYVFMRVDQRTADRMLKEAYEFSCDHIMRGGALPPIPAGEIEHEQEKERKRASEETVRKHCADLEKLFGLDGQPDEPTEQAA